MLSLRNLSIGFGLALCALTFAACGGNGNTFTNPTPGPTCSPNTTVQLIYPIPGATGVPDAPQQIVFALATPLPSIWDAYIAPSSTGSNGGYTSGLQTIPA